MRLAFTGHRPESLPFGENELSASVIHIKTLLADEIIQLGAAAQMRRVSLLRCAGFRDSWLGYANAASRRGHDTSNYPLCNTARVQRP